VDADVLRHGNAPRLRPGRQSRPDFYDKDRTGANLYTNSIVALDARTGKLAWYYQVTPHDVRDYDFTHTSPVFTTDFLGARHKVIALTGKDGLLRLFDRDTRKVLYKVPFTTRENADGKIGTNFVRTAPAFWVDTNGMALHTARCLNALFVPPPIGAPRSAAGQRHPISST